MVSSTQIVHQSCRKSSTIFKRTEPSYHLSPVTQESHRVRPKWFLCLWYVQCKSCTYLALTLTLSPNGLKRDSTGPTSLTSSIRCVQNYLWAYGTLSANRATSCVKISNISKRTKQSSTRPSSPRSTIECVQNDLWAYGKYDANRALILHRH
jgi:hypothetical protein